MLAQVGVYRLTSNNNHHQEIQVDSGGCSLQGISSGVPHDSVVLTHVLTLLAV